MKKIKKIAQEIFVEVADTPNESVMPVLDKSKMMTIEKKISEQKVSTVFFDTFSKQLICKIQAGFWETLPITLKTDNIDEAALTAILKDTENFSIEMKNECLRLSNKFKQLMFEFMDELKTNYSKFIELK